MRMDLDWKGQNIMKIVDERKNKDIEEEWNIGDVIEVGGTEDTFLGMIIIDDNYYYWFLNLEAGNTTDTNVNGHSVLDDLISDIKVNYFIARKVNVELHIKKGNE